MGRRPAKGCLVAFGALVGLLIVFQLGAELWFRRTSNQVAIISDAVGGFACADASVKGGDWNPLWGHVDFYDDMRIAMPSTCIADLKATVMKNETFRFGDCTQADRCWTNMVGSGGEFVEFHFLEREIIFRHGRI